MQPLFLSLSCYACRCVDCVRHTQTDRMIWMVFGPSFHFHFHFSMCIHRHTPPSSHMSICRQHTKRISCIRVALVPRLFFFHFASIEFCRRWLCCFLLLLLFAYSLIAIFRVAPCVCTIVYSISCNLRVIASNEWKLVVLAVWRWCFVCC